MMASKHDKGVRITILVFVLAATAVLAPAGLSADTFGLFVSGLGGDEEYETAFIDIGRLLYESAIASGMDETRMTWLAESVEADQRVRTRSTKEALLAELERFRTEMQKGDLLWLVLVGHGSYRDSVSKVNLPGPDLTDRELRSALDQFPGDRSIVIVNTASASGGFLGALSGPGRVVLTATKSAAQRNNTTFGTHFASAFAERAADTDQDGFVSALEAFRHASELVASYYEDRNLLVTENALLDDNGDGEGSLTPDALGGEDGVGDGVLAAKLVLGAAALSRVERTPANLAALERKAELQGKLDSLRRQKTTLEEGLYLQELQKILVEIARIDQKLRSQAEEPSEAQDESEMRL